MPERLLFARCQLAAHHLKTNVPIARGIEAARFLQPLSGLLAFPQIVESEREAYMSVEQCFAAARRIQG